MTKNAIPHSLNGTATLRLDKWLWHARFFKSRSQAAKYVLSGKIRLNRHRVSKPSTSVRPGDVLTFALRHHVHVVEIATLGERRGPVSEARSLYIDLSSNSSMTAGAETAPLDTDQSPSVGAAA